MDFRIRKLRDNERTERENGLSRSLPTHGNCFPSCLHTSTDSIPSVGSRSPRLGQYRKIPNQSECDVCNVLTKDVTNLKCLHTFCEKCLDGHRIIKNGCPVCNSLCNRENNGQFGIAKFEKYSPEKEAVDLNDGLLFQNFDEDIIDGRFSIEELENKVLKSVESRIRGIKQELNQLDIDADRESKKIREHVERVKKMIDKKAECMIKNIYESKGRHSAELARQDKFLKETHEQICNMLKQFKNTTNSRTYDDVSAKSKMADSVKKLIKLSDQIAEENVHIRFNVKPVNDSILETVTGRVGVRVFIVNPIQLNLQQVFEFSGGVHSICPVDGNRAWIGYQNFIQLCTKEGKVQKKINVKEDVHDLAIDKKGSLYIACHSRILTLNSNFELSTLFMCERAPCGITCRDDGNIVACEGKDVVVYNTCGNRVSVLNADNMYDMKMPYKIAINTNGDICVSDYQSSTGEVAIFDSDGRLKARIRTEAMAPRGIACSSQGFIYVADFRADRINMYSTHGHFLQTALNAGEDKLSGPLSVAIDNAGDLWVGDWKRKVRIYSQTCEKTEEEVRFS